MEKSVEAQLAVGTGGNLCCPAGPAALQPCCRGLTARCMVSARCVVSAEAKTRRGAWLPGGPGKHGSVCLLGSHLHGRSCQERTFPYPGGVRGGSTLLPGESRSGSFIGMFDSLTECAKELLDGVVIRSTSPHPIWLCVKSI